MGVRRQGWERPFYDYLQAAALRPFSWGEFDCCMFVAEAVEIITGTQITQQHKGAYDSLETAQAYLGSFGGLGDLFKATFTPLGGKRVRPLYAKRGDVLALHLPTENGMEDIGAVCAGQDVLFLTDIGMRRVSLSAAAKVSTSVWSFY